MYPQDFKRTVDIFSHNDAWNATIKYRCGLADGQSPGNGRKVRSPQGSVPANGRAGSQEPDGKCNRKNTARMAFTGSFG